MSRLEAGSLGAVKRWAATRVRLDRVCSALQGVVGAPVAIRVRRVGPAASAPAFEGTTGVVLAPLGAAPDDAVLLEMEGALAGALVARALRRPAPVLVKPGVVSESAAGAVAAIVAATARRAHAGTAIEVRRAGSASPSGVPVAPSTAVALTLTVLVGDEAFAARATFGRRRLDAAAEEAAPWSAALLAALGATPLAIPIVACAVLLTVTELAALGPGDVLLPGGGDVTGGLVSTPDGLTGQVLLAPPGCDHGVRADLVAGPRLVLRGERAPLCTATTEDAMTGEGGGSALVEAIGEVPVVVRVEVGEAVMSARDWASLGPGDVVGLGRRVGEQVVLRVGGLPVARGELVDIEGEVGVRIVARLSEETTAG